MAGLGKHVIQTRSRCGIDGQARSCLHTNQFVFISINSCIIQVWLTNDARTCYNTVALRRSKDARISMLR